jgi:hypothetical protein
MIAMTERIVKQWADNTLYHYGGNKYEYMANAAFSGIRIIADSDSAALDHVSNIEKVVNFQK